MMILEQWINLRVNIATPGSQKDPPRNSRGEGEEGYVIYPIQFKLGTEINKAKCARDIFQCSKRMLCR